jgi:hypothetical protein
MISREKREIFHRDFSLKISDPLSHGVRLPTSDPTEKTTGNLSKNPKKPRKTQKNHLISAKTAAIN